MTAVSWKLQCVLVILISSNFLISKLDDDGFVIALICSKCLGCVYVQRESKSSDFKGVSGTLTFTKLNVLYKYFKPEKILYWGSYLYWRYFVLRWTMSTQRTWIYLAGLYIAVFILHKNNILATIFFNLVKFAFGVSKLSHKMIIGAIVSTL